MIKLTCVDVSKAILRKAPNLSIVFILTSLLVACGDGVSTESAPSTVITDVSNYNGPAANTSDVQAFKLNVWDNLKGTNRCGSCHVNNAQSPTFVRLDDINQAYAAANTIVTLNDPSASAMVTKVAGGHNCWLASDSACASVITAYIEGWAGSSGNVGRTIELKPPPIMEPGDSKNFPDDTGLFSSTVYPLLTARCSNCHDNNALIPQAPYFASSDVSESYEAVKTKIDLDSPANSRLVVRLSEEFHNCWTDCTPNSSEMETAIENMANQILVTQIDPQLVISKALKLTDGVVASGGSRHEANQIALYEFKAGQGSIAYDTSGVEPAINLNFTGDISWVNGWGIEIRTGKAQGSTATSKKLSDMIKSTGEYSIEAWIAPSNVTQEGPARIISYSGGTNTRNFTLGQTQYNYDYMNRTDATDGNGEPVLSTADADEDLQATQQHVVVTFDPANGRRLFVNGVYTDDPDTIPGGNLSAWDDSFAFVLGNEVSGDRQWQGKFRLVALHNRALTSEQIQNNYQIGVGEKFFLLFSVEHLVSVAQSYILFEVAQFDNYSYLFNQPKFISLDQDAQVGDIAIEGLRIGLNGKETDVGQVYDNLSTSVTDSTFMNQEQILSSLGTIISSEKGADSDEFFLTFERIGQHNHVRTGSVPLIPQPPTDSDPVSDIGLRLFDEINSSMSAVTSVSSQNSEVVTTYNSIKQQLPSVENIEGFLSAQQVAVSQLAIEYCNALVNDAVLRGAYFPGFNFSDHSSIAFDQPAKRELITDPLLVNINGLGLSTQPDPNSIETEMNNLIDRLISCGNSCPADRTETTIKAVCSAVVGSAVLLLQ